MPIRSNSKQAKRIIRREISRFKRPGYGARTVLQAMKRDADAYNCGDHPRKQHTDYDKGAAIVDAGDFALLSRQDKMLSKIYGKKVQGWSGQKTHSTYRHLIAREYDSMLREERKKKSTPTRRRK